MNTSSIGKITILLQTAILYFLATTAFAFEDREEALKQVNNGVACNFVFTHFEYRKSTSQTVGTVRFREPYSKTNELRLSVGIRYGMM